MNKIGEEVISISAGSDHSLIWTKSGRIMAAGLNEHGQLGTGNNKSWSAFTQLKDMDHIKIIDVSAGNQHSAWVSSNRELYIWGTECFGEFLIPHLVKTVKGRVQKVSLGKNFGTVMTEKGDVYVWGSNDVGQLGLGDLVDRPTPSKLTTLKNKVITSISAGSTFVIALGETIKSKNKSQSNKNVNTKRSVSGNRIQNSSSKDQSYDLLDLSPSNKTPEGSFKGSVQKIPRPISGKSQNDSFDNRYHSNQLSYKPLSDYSKRDSQGGRNKPEEIYHNQNIDPVLIEDFESDRGQKYKLRESASFPEINQDERSSNKPEFWGKSQGSRL